MCRSAWCSWGTESACRHLQSGRGRPGRTASELRGPAGRIQARTRAPWPTAARRWRQQLSTPRTAALHLTAQLGRCQRRRGQRWLHFKEKLSVRLRRHADTCFTGSSQLGERVSGNVPCVYDCWLCAAAFWKQEITRIKSEFSLSTCNNCSGTIITCRCGRTRSRCNVDI